MSIKPIINPTDIPKMLDTPGNIYRAKERMLKFMKFTFNILNCEKCSHTSDGRMYLQRHGQENQNKHRFMQYAG